MLTSQQNFRDFSGDTSQHCMVNSSYYTAICGPRGTETLALGLWKELYPHGFAEYDARIYEDFAAKMRERATETQDPLAIAAADAWELRDIDAPLPDQGAPFLHLMCQAMRQSEAGL